MAAHLSKTGSKVHRGMALAFAGYTAFSFSDVCVKLLTERGYSVFQVVTVDTLVACITLLLFAPFIGGLKSLRDPLNAKIHALRAVLNTAVNLGLVYSFTLMPLATVYTAVFTKPIIAALIAVPLYGEKIGLNRVVSIALGLAGILVAFQPWHADMSQANIPLLMLTTSVIAMMFLFARSLKNNSSLLAMTFYPIFGSFVATLPFMIFNYSPFALADMPFFVLSGVCVAGAIMAVSFAFRYTDSAAVSPIMYTQMIWAILFGALVFGDPPSFMTLLGAGIIAASGIYLVFSEKYKKISPEHKQPL